MIGLTNGWLEFFTAVSFLMVLVVASFLICYLIMNRQARRLQVVRQTLRAREGDPFPVKFVLLSDLHLPRMPLSWEMIFRSILLEKPSFVVITGDLCDSQQATGQVLSFVALLAERVRRPVYITYGNHDNQGAFCGNTALKRSFTRMLEDQSPFVKVLENECDVLNCDAYGSWYAPGEPHPGRETRTIYLGGLGDWRSDQEPKQELVRQWRCQAKNNDGFLLLATHNSDILLDLEEGCCDALVAGHTHAGQIWMPFQWEFRLLRMKDKLARKGYIYGKLDYKKIPFYITSGLGCSVLPMRFRSCAEIAVLTI